MTKLWSYEVGPKTGELRDVVETKHPDVVTLANDVATFEIGFGCIFSPFKPIIRGFKAQPLRRQ